jgi:hypothetical protein
MFRQLPLQKSAPKQASNGGTRFKSRHPSTPSILGRSFLDIGSDIRLLTPDGYAPSMPPLHNGYLRGIFGLARRAVRRIFRPDLFASLHGIPPGPANIEQEHAEVDNGRDFQVVHWLNWPVGRMPTLPEATEDRKPGAKLLISTPLCCLL